MGSRVSHRSAGGATLRPPADRALRRLPGPRALWIVIWALVPWANGAVNLVLDTESKSAIWEQSGTLVVLSYAAVSVAILLSIWGGERIARRLEALRGAEPFREVNHPAAPLLGTLATAAAFGVTAFVQDGLVPAMLRGGTWLVVGFALWSFLWTDISLHVGLYRLGAEPVPEESRMDPDLGLRPLGDVAFTALWILLAWLVPLVLTGLSDTAGFAIGVTILLAALVAFFLSLVRLHHRMVDVKAEELALARDLYAQAYRPVRERPTLETLEQQRSLLAAADALEQRAKGIHDWPIDEGTFARVLTIATSVIAVLIARLILDPFGL